MFQFNGILLFYLAANEVFLWNRCCTLLSELLRKFPTTGSETCETQLEY